MAVTQHYGLPTRLLDWTKNPFVAAYFAAREAATWCAGGAPASPGDKRLCVWAFSAEYLVRAQHRESDESVDIVSAATALIPNLALQQGMFTVDRRRQGTDETVRREPFDALLRSIVDAGPAPDHPVLVQLVLPVEAAPELLRRLSWHDVDASAVHAGHVGAAEAVKERCFWDIPDPVAVTAQP